MHAMERSEPSLIPEWLRSNGASSQADGPALPLNRSLKSTSNSDSLHSSLLDRSSSFNYRRSTVSNGFSKHDKNSYTRPYSSFSRSHRDRDRDRERSTFNGSCDSEHPDPLRGMINGRAEDPLRRSQSLISSRNGEAPQRRISADIRNGVHKNHDNGTKSVIGNGTGIHKVSFERDFPVLRSEERPKTPDVIRVSSPVLSRGVIGNPPLAGIETWTSALADAPSGTGSNVGVGSSPAINMAKALVQIPVQSYNAPQLQKDEFALAQSKKLIPVISLPKTTILSSSDKLKAKTTTRFNETAVTPKNGVHHPSPLLVGSQPIRGEIVKGDDPKSPSAGKLLLLKPGRENGASLKDSHIPTINLNVGAANGQSTGSSTPSSGPSKNSHNPKILPGLNTGALVDKRTSRSNFFKLVREKSSNNTVIGSGVLSSVDVVNKLDNEPKDSACTQVDPAESRGEVACDGEICTVADNLSPPMEVDNEEERAFLLSLGWEDKAEDGEEGITEEEIRAFWIKVMKQGATSKLCSLLQAKLYAHGFSSSCESNTSVSQTEA